MSDDAVDLELSVEDGNEKHVASGRMFKITTTISIRETIDTCIVLKVLARSWIVAIRFYKHHSKQIVEVVMGGALSDVNERK